MFDKENVIKNCKKKKNEIKEVTRKCLNLIDLKYSTFTSLINKKNSSGIFTNYQFSDEEIKFCEEENCSNDVYFPESSYTSNDFKNLLGWVPRSLKISEPISTDSIPCAFFFLNDDKSTRSDKIILYLHKFNEDLGMIIPTVNALHKKLNLNIIAMEYSGYGASFDIYEQKSVSIVNDAFTILKFIFNFLKIPYSNVYIMCYEFLASPAIEVVNRLEEVYGENGTLGGLILIKPQFIEIVNTSAPNNNNNNNNDNNNNNNTNDIILADSEADNEITHKGIFDEYVHTSIDEEVIIDEESVIDDERVIKQKFYNTNGKKSSEKIEKSKKRINNNNRTNGKKGGGNEEFSNNTNIQHINTKNNICRDSMKNGNNMSTDDGYNNVTSYQFYNGIVRCNMSFFYTENSEPLPTEDMNIPCSLMKRILKDSFDIKHVINSIKSICCSILIFHSENDSYKNSSSHILLSNAKECSKKAAFSFDFMNEDFITAFKWFFSEKCNSQVNDKLFKNLLYLYVPPVCNNEENKNNNPNETKSTDINRSIYYYSNAHNSSTDFNESFSSITKLNSIDSDSDNNLKRFHMNKCDSYNEPINTIHIPDSIFICPEVIQETNTWRERNKQI
ncbi:conserved Plasmodium protein, unknown function [Plasmodium yoelii]|uniref:Alpha/beta hydrolase n=2 Tax=Plasmodium yoelii TaxID=5861 RepID=A0AAF0B5C8_PLAYO|nr:conserved Plasmodium protein, unknown function [Plasmodium yoelii]WBY58711.1 alpha/beta hydrolase [Plasmodium yoelii yoelii]CDU18991.1 conserved Plasmodium protein, unknown function [Plasmodium yoelii]VTZ79576.1 conserved Plasmodium protein, unknown function [Plasmodium yoelii]|eukprot:XP_726878.2 conserved Plasmodium protein, unknown function [Plasmodium yoelii]